MLPELTQETKKVVPELTQETGNELPELAQETEKTLSELAQEGQDRSEKENRVRTVREVLLELAHETKKAI